MSSFWHNTNFIGEFQVSAAVQDQTLPDFSWDPHCAAFCFALQESAQTAFTKGEKINHSLTEQQDIYPAPVIGWLLFHFASIELISLPEHLITGNRLTDCSFSVDGHFRDPWETSALHN